MLRRARGSSGAGRGTEGKEDEGRREARLEPRAQPEGLRRRQKGAAGHAGEARRAARAEGELRGASLVLKSLHGDAAAAAAEVVGVQLPQEGEEVDL